MSGSGTVFLEEVVGWDQEKRRERVEEALPQLLNHHSHEEAIGILQIVCQAFLPLVPKEDLELKVFSDVCHQVCMLVDDILEAIHVAVQQNQETPCDQLNTLLQHISNILECVEECVRHIVNLSDGVQVSQVHSLIHCTLHVLKASYGHCQESSQLYGDGLPSLSESLSNIFRRAHSLQMAFLNLLEKTAVVGSVSEGDVQDITEVCEGLFSLCRLVASLELRLTVSLWKALSKLTVQHKEKVCTRIDLCSIVSYLCEEIRGGVAQLLESAPPTSGDEVMLSQGDDKTFTKSLKILNFQLKVLVTMVKDCLGYLGASVPNIHSLMLYLNSITPPCLSAAKLQSKHEDMVKQQLCYAVPPLTSHLLTCSQFRDCILNDKDVDDDKCFPHLLLQVSVMENLRLAPVEVVTEWLSQEIQTSASTLSHHNILSATFTSLEKCHVEVCLPVYLTDSATNASTGQPQRKVSLYQHTVEHICAFIGSCPAKLFPVVEEDLLRTLLNPNPISSLAAADTWCFVARYGTADLCLHHARQLLGLCQDVKSQAPFSCSIKCLTSLVGRLIKFLTPEQQAELLAAFPPASHVALWADIGLEGLSEGVAKDVIQSLVPSCLRMVKTFSQSSNFTVGNAVEVIPALMCLHNILQCETTACHLTPQHGAGILDSVSSLWRAWPVDKPLPSITDPPPNCGRVCQLYLAALVKVTADIVDQLDARLLLQVLVFSHKAVTGSVLGELTLSVVHLLGALGPVKLPPSFEQGQILRKIADTFAVVLSHGDSVIQHRAFVAFRRFAEQTAYEAVVPECLAQNEGLQEKMTAYLQKVPLAKEGQNFDTVTFLRQQREKLKAKMAPAVEPKNTLKSLFSDSSGTRKRQRLANDTSTENQNTGYEAVMEDLETVVIRMESLRVQEPMPDWVIARSQPLLQRLATCFDASNR